MEVKYFGSEALSTLIGLIKGGLSGKLGTGDTAEAAKKLETPRNINGVPFDGTEDIQIGDTGEGPDMSDYYTKNQVDQKLLTDVAASFNGRKGAVVPQEADYAAYYAAKPKTQTATLTVSGWGEELSQTVAAKNVAADNLVFVSPDPKSWEAYGAAGVRMTAQGSGTATFTVTEKPEDAITVNIVAF